MRITQSMINRTMLQSINDSKQSLSKIQNEISTGTKIFNSSDNPVGFSRSVNYQNTINQNEQYIANIIDSNGWMETSYSVLDEFYELTMDAKDVALQGADDGIGRFQRDALADKINSIFEAVMSLSNTTYRGKNVFAGTNTLGESSFTSDGTDVVYNGNSEAISRRISENYDITINIAGDELMDTGIFDTMINLRDALRNDDVAGIDESITDLDNTSNSLLSIISGLSSVKNQSVMTQTRLETANINLNSFLSQTRDVDLAEAIAVYGVEEIAYKAALQTTSDAVKLNLLDYLR